VRGRTVQLYSDAGDGGDYKIRSSFHSSSLLSSYPRFRLLNFVAGANYASVRTEEGVNTKDISLGRPTKDLTHYPYICYRTESPLPSANSPLMTSAQWRRSRRLRGDGGDGGGGLFVVAFSPLAVVIYPCGILDRTTFTYASFLFPPAHYSCCTLREGVESSMKLFWSMPESTLLVV